MPSGSRRWCLLVGLSALTAVAALAVGCTPPIKVSGFAPPSNVVSFTHPKLADYPLRRIVVLHFDNKTPSPDAGETISEFFYEELKLRTTKIVLPPMPADYSKLNLEIPLGHRVGGRLPPPKVSPKAIEGILEQLEPALREAIAAEGRSPPSEGLVPSGSGLDAFIIPREIRLTEAEKAEVSDRLWVGDRLADGLVVGVIGRYRNRQGNSLTVRNSASVAYDVYLLSTIDGAVLWQASFDETQVPLFENIMLMDRFLKGGGVWQTHDTLARIGMARVLATFPGVSSPLSSASKPATAPVASRKPQPIEPVTPSQAGERKGRQRIIFESIR